MDLNLIVNKIGQFFNITDNWIIIIFFIINLIFFFVTSYEIKKTERLFNPENDRVNGVQANMAWGKKEISDLRKMRKTVMILYTWYANITAIFPLLGILGTVAALVTYSEENMMESFMTALSTTLLGVFCAIFFKCFDGFISGPLDVIVEDADRVIQDFELEKRR